MKPKELATSMIALSHIEFNSNDYYKLMIGWDNGVLECSLLSKVRFGDKKTEYHSILNEKDFDLRGGVETPLLSSSSHGSKRLDYIIRPSHNIDIFHSKVVDGINRCIKVYEKQLKTELDQTLKSIALIKQQK